jgi:hypothetical protein
MPGIGSLNEKHLHLSLKEWYARTDDQLETTIDGFVIDILRGDMLVEIQTKNVAGIKSKLISLTRGHRTRLVYPIAREKWIVKPSGGRSGGITRRRSPKRGRIEDVFTEMVSAPQLLADPNFSLEVLLIKEEEVRRRSGRRGWRRRGWSIDERRLLEVVDRKLFEGPSDLKALLPHELAEPFTSSDLSEAAGISRALAQKMTYCLRRAGVIDLVGKQGRAHLYRIVNV